MPDNTVLENYSDIGVEVKKEDYSDLGVEVTPVVPELRNAPPATFIDKIKSFFTDPEKDIAKAQNVYALSEATGLQLKDVYNNYDLLRRSSKITGITPDLERREYMAIAMTPFIATAAIANPIGTTAGLLAYAALDKAIPTDKIVKGIEKGMGGEFSDTTKTAIDLIDFIGKGLIVGGVFKRAPKLAEGFLKQKLVEYNLTKDITLSKEQVRDIFQTRKLTTAEEQSLFGSLNLSGQELRNTLQEGVKISIPAEKLTTLVDKPIWAKIKSIVGAESKPKVVSELAGQPKKAVAGLIEGEIAPKEAITAPIAPKAVENPLPLAIRLKSGEVISDATAKLHSDIVTAKGINPDDVQDVGYIEQPTGAVVKPTPWNKWWEYDIKQLANDLSAKDMEQLEFQTRRDTYNADEAMQARKVADIWEAKGNKSRAEEIRSKVPEGGEISQTYQPTGEGKVTLADIKLPSTTMMNQSTIEAMTKAYKEGNPVILDRPISVRKAGEGYEIIEGEHRAVAAKAAGIEPPIVVLTDAQVEGLNAPEVDTLARQEYAKQKLSTPTGKYIPTKLPDSKGGTPLETLPKVPEELMNKVKASVSGKIAGQAEKIPSLQTETKENIETPVSSPSIESMTPESNPVKKIIEAIKKAKDIRGQQETLYSKARAAKLAKMSAIGEKVGGQKGFYARLGALKGELPKVEFESIVKELKQEDIDSLFNMIKDSPHLSEWDRLSAFEGLNNLLGQTGGRVPTETQIKFLHKVFGKEFTEALLEKRPLFTKMKEAGLQIANIPRSIMSSFDLSFGLRQGAFLAPRYRKEFIDSWTKQFGWFKSEDIFKEAMQVVSENPNYELAVESGVAFTEMDSLITEREERLASQWSEKIPLVGKGVRASARAYTAFANKFRMDTFSKLIQDAQDLGLNPQKDRDLSKAIAEFVNNGTGRGDLGDFERTALALNAFFFSPRLMASRLNLLNPVYYVNQNPFVRKQAIKSLLTFLGTGLTILTMAKLMGADVGKDPRSSDFGKIKIGNTRIDIWGGFQQYIRMAGQMISGQYVSSTTGKVMTLGEGYKPLTRLDILMRQIESKEAPVFSLFTDILKGQDFEGKPINIPKEVGMRFVPMVIQDLYDVIKDNPEAAPAVMLAPFGVGVQTYKQKGRRF